MYPWLFHYQYFLFFYIDTNDTGSKCQDHILTLRSGTQVLLLLGPTSALKMELNEAPRFQLLQVWYDTLFVTFSHSALWTLRSWFSFLELHGKSQLTPGMSGEQNTQLQQKCSALSKGFNETLLPTGRSRKGPWGSQTQQGNICLNFRHCSQQYKPKIRYLLQETNDSSGHQLRVN